MPLWYAAALAYQSALHAIFFIVFLNGKHPARAFGILWTLLVFVLFPIGSWIGEYDLFIKNAFFCGSLVVLCRFLFRDQKMRKIILAVLLYEIMLVLFEILAVPTMYLLFGFVPDLRMYGPIQKVFTLIACIWLAVFVFGTLSVVSKAPSAHTKMFWYLACLLFNVILLVLAVCQIFIPYNPSFFESSYWGVVAVLIGANLATLFSLTRVIRRERQRQVAERLEYEYKKQLLLYMENDQREEGWRRLRHDLLNFWEENQS